MILACIKVGKKYSPDYVNRLYSMARRNYEGDLDFRCFTDDESGLDDDIRLNVDMLPVPWLNAWWHKISFFGPGAFTDEPFTMIDLDCVITGNINWLDNDHGDFCGIYDWGERHRYNGGLWTLKPGTQPQVWDNFIMQPDRVLEQYTMDDKWISDNIKERNFYQDHYPGKVLSYKMDVLKGVDVSRASIVFFHGQPKPHSLMVTPWIRENWR